MDKAEFVSPSRGAPLKNHWNVSIAVVDDGGHVLWLQRLDGAAAISAQIAPAKARTAAFNSGAYAADDLQALLAPVTYFADSVDVAPVTPSRATR